MIIYLNIVNMFYRMKTYNFYEKNILAKYRIELLGDVVFLVRNLLVAQLDNHVRVGLAVEVHGMQFASLHDVDSNQNMDGIIRRKSLRKWEKLKL